MKTSRDPRHQKRVQIVQELFAWQFRSETEIKLEETQKVIENREQIDKIISDAAPEWPIAQINRIDLAILRLAIYELVVDKSTPFKVVVDEAVELAKSFGSEGSPGFINGTLGKVVSETTS